DIGLYFSGYPVWHGRRATLRLRHKIMSNALRLPLRFSPGSWRRSARLVTTVARPSSPDELVGGGEGRHLVALGERGVVEDGVEEVVEAAPKGEDRLADVDQLGSPGAHDVHAEQAAVVAVEDHLEETAVVAHDLPARDLPVARHPGLVGDLLLGQLVLR